jgi:hypothetical protein
MSVIAAMAATSSNAEQLVTVTIFRLVAAELQVLHVCFQTIDASYVINANTRHTAMHGPAFPNGVPASGAANVEDRPRITHLLIKDIVGEFLAYRTFFRFLRMLVHNIGFIFRWT